MRVRKDIVQRLQGEANEGLRRKSRTIHASNTILAEIAHLLKKQGFDEDECEQLIARVQMGAKTYDSNTRIDKLIHDHGVIWDNVPRG